MAKKRTKSTKGKRLLIHPSGQMEMYDKSYQQELEEQKSKAVECLGQTFENDDARREHFLGCLRAGLKELEAKLGGVSFTDTHDAIEHMKSIENWTMGDDERLHRLADCMRHGDKSKDLLQLWKDEVGFPHGEIDDILALSDPPYYTACPNPFLGEFVTHYGKSFDPDEPYHREPFATDVSEGKNNPIYNAHSYHTKVPHKAIMRYILHYTEPGDVVFDGFCGTGMAGVGAQLCDVPEVLASLGYRVGRNGQLKDENDEIVGTRGARYCILNDLSPSATLIAAGYNLTENARRFAKLAGRLLEEFNAEYGWMYETQDPTTGQKCPVDFTIWSEIFSCPHCSGELEFWSLAYDDRSGKVLDKPICPHCKAKVSKRELLRKTMSYYDVAVGETRQRQVLRPVEIRYKHRGEKKAKAPDKNDLAVLDRVQELLAECHYPIDLMMFVPEGDEWGDLFRGYHQGISRVHDFQLSRQLVAFTLLWKKGEKLSGKELQRLWRFLLQSVMVSFTRRNRFLKNAYSQVNRALSGTLYIGSTISEPSPTYVLTGKIKRFSTAIPKARPAATITTQSLASISLPTNSVDYVFIDPPFGDNLPYAELNFLWEAWLGVFTNASQDTVVSGKQEKSLSAYTDMMTACLKEVHRVLKPGRWATIEFHNSKNAVWTAIQEALGRAGFIIADVSVLDKGMRTKKQLHAKAVDKDLVISAYKPNGGLEDRFRLEAGTEQGVWDFVRTHLGKLPVFLTKDSQVQVVAERQNFLLFDRMVAFHVQRGVTVPFSAGEFYQGLDQRLVPRDGMYFLPEQAAEYDRKRIATDKVLQLDLFVHDEASAIRWMKQLLIQKPQTFRELQPQFMQETQGGWERHEKALELSELLGQNFIRYDGDGEVPCQIHSYLSSNWHELRSLPKDSPELRTKAKDRWYVPDPNKAGDLEKLRERTLVREFEEYRASKQKRLKVFRLEAVRAGFKKCYDERDYQTIVDVAAKIPDAVLEEDDKLLMFYDVARMRLGEDETLGF